ncbi:glycerol kinase [Plasmodiophora brassicae]|uniref:glycerol kinase n=1 Tax=Plasmodiophora brassicae TaxID=37360 RepID=A0A3P3YBB4_PLABS|nr:unnamed protein product [Plasmodiophora brassicae]
MAAAAGQYVGAVDQGTSSTRFALFDRSGAMVASEQQPIKIISTRPGWAEHDPVEMLEIVRRCIGEVMRPRNSSDVVSVGVTNQRETLVAWDPQTGSPFYNAILWLDTRTADTCSALERKTGSKDYFRSICGLPISTYFSAVKMMWLMENVPDVKKAVKQRRCLIGTVDCWLIWNLTGGPQGGVHVTDVTNASRTMLMDLKTLHWSPAVCDMLGIPRHVLPKIASSSEKYGEFEETSPLARIPISGCIGDQHAAMLGQLCFQPGQVKTTYGTGAFMVCNTGRRIVQSKHGLLTTVCFKLGPNADCLYALEGSVAYAGAIVQWLRDHLGIINSSAEINKLAESVPDNGGVYFVTALSGLFAPHWRDDARGLIIGLTQHSTKAHIARAALEAVCYSIREVMEAMEKDSGTKLTLLRVDGGMSVSDTIMQMQANVVQLQTERPSMLETTALGAAIAAGLASGFWTSIDDVTACCGTSYKVFSPNVPRPVYEATFSKYKRAIRRAIGWIPGSPEESPSAHSKGKVRASNWLQLSAVSIGSAAAGALLMRLLSR